MGRRSGTTFRRFYTAAAVCAPSRLPASEVTIAAALKERGYTTGLFGKWHAGSPRPGASTWIHPLDRGFDEFFGYTNAVAAWQKFPKQLWDGRAEKPVSGYADTLFTDHAIDFITRHKGEPFFAYVPFITSHGVVEAPPEDIAEHTGTIKDYNPAKPVNATYAAEVTRLDKEVGRILKTLDDLKLADDTIVIFTSDHGATFEKLSEFEPIDLNSNYPFRGQKRTLWEGGIRVPGAIRWPGHVPAGVESQSIIHMTDLFPTLLAAAGGTPKPEWKVDGLNQLDVIEGKRPAPDRTLFWEWDEGGAKYAAAMHGDLKIVTSGGNRPEMDNVAKDLAERIDVSARHPAEQQRLKKALADWLATTVEASKQKKAGDDAPATTTRKSYAPNVNDL